uniref:Uncharacterized protein n=1 Tax=Arundo donax TaxID=35708 RepID=A0A0A9BEQ3_ARUDO
MSFNYYFSAMMLIDGSLMLDMVIFKSFSTGTSYICNCQQT